MDEVRVLLSSYAFNTSNGTVEPHVMTANDIARRRWTRENELLGIIKPVTFVKFEWIWECCVMSRPEFLLTKVGQLYYMGSNNAKQNR